jgi:hypothetical protein
MKRSSLLILLVVTLAFCKNKKEEPQPLPELTGIVSKWRLVSTESVRGDSVIVQQAAPGEARIIAFRYDGILVNEAGQATCCAPAAYILNGVKFEIKPIGTAPPMDPQCIYVDCWSPPEWKLTQEGDTLIIESVANYKEKYVRVVT